MATYSISSVWRMSDGKDRRHTGRYTDRGVNMDIFLFIKPWSTRDLPILVRHVTLSSNGNLLWEKWVTNLYSRIMVQISNCSLIKCIRVLIVWLPYSYRSQILFFLSQLFTAILRGGYTGKKAMYVSENGKWNFLLMKPLNCSQQHWFF